MKTKNIFLLTALLFAFLLVTTYEGCGSDTTGPPPSAGGFKPTLRMKIGSTFQYTNDTIKPPPPYTTERTNMVTNDTVKLITNYNGKDAYGIISHTTNRPTVMYYVSYDSSNGVLYQWGITNLINPSQSPSWDVVANFGAARGSSWVIGQINDTLILPSPYGSVPISGPLSGKVADSTFIITTSTTTPDTIHCYRIELNANISGTVVVGAIQVTFSATIYVDYYLGYYSSQFPNNPSGLVRLTLHPFNITTSPNIITIQEGGYDRILQSFTIAP
jgi:hypothetical protein